MLEPIQIDLNGFGVLFRVVVADDFNRGSLRPLALINSHQPIEGVFGLTDSRETKDNTH